MVFERGLTRTWHRTSGCRTALASPPTVGIGFGHQILISLTQPPTSAPLAVSRDVFPDSPNTPVRLQATPSDATVPPLSLGRPQSGPTKKYWGLQKILGSARKNCLSLSRVTQEGCEKSAFAELTIYLLKSVHI